MSIRAGTLWIFTITTIMAVLVLRIAAGDGDTSPAAPSAQESNAAAEASALLGDLAGDPVLGASAIEFSDESSANTASMSEAFEDLGRAGAIILLSTLLISSGLIGAVWLKGRLVY